MSDGTQRYDVEADWQLLNACNYRCAYCFFSDATLGEKFTQFVDPQVWPRAFDQTGLRWLVHMTGGEPSAYPGFPELCKYLTLRHLILINSNMTGSYWQSFAQQIDPDTVTFINAGLHLTERQRKNGSAIFLQNVELLRVVMTPDALARFDEAKELLGTIGMFPIPKAMRGKFEEKWYPHAYTATERKLFRSYSRLARDFYAYTVARLPERPTVDVFNDDSILHGELPIFVLRGGASVFQDSYERRRISLRPVEIIRKHFKGHIRPQRRAYAVRQLLLFLFLSEVQQAAGFAEKAPSFRSGHVP
jgi:organic radical activating enzyme